MIRVRRRHLEPDAERLKADRRAFAEDTLGPLFLEFLARLGRRLRSIGASPPQPAVALFVARAGLRIRFLFEAYLRERGETLPVPSVDAYLSRLTMVRAVLAEQPGRVAQLVAHEYHMEDSATMLKGLLRGASIDWERFVGLPPSARDLMAFLAEGSADGEAARSYLAEQADLTRRYMRAALAGSKIGVLVDSGWNGTAQRMLGWFLPETVWRGLYIGRWSYGGPEPSHFADMEGLLVDGAVHRPHQLRGAILRYHHIIEGPLEIPFPSVTAYRVHGPRGEVAPDTGTAAPSVLLGNDDEPHFRGVLDYVVAHAGDDPAGIAAAGGQAATRLAHGIWFPKRAQVAVLDVGARSRDFGKEGANRVVYIEPRGDQSLEARLNRVRRSLWREGQIALEFPRAVATLMQRAMIARRALNAFLGRG